jgi:hypothetical protein
MIYGRQNPDGSNSFFLDQSGTQEISVPGGLYYGEVGTAAPSSSSSYAGMIQNGSTFVAGTLADRAAYLAGQSASAQATSAPTPGVAPMVNQPTSDSTRSVLGAEQDETNPWDPMLVRRNQYDVGY